MVDLKWDRSFALEQSGGEEEILAELLELFRKTLLSDLAKIREGIEALDAEAVADAAHSVKGASATLGVEAIRQVAYEIEKAGRSDDLATVKGNLAVFEEIVASLEQLQ